MSFSCIAQELTDKQKHDALTDQYADVIFDPHKKPFSSQLEAFENAQGVKLGFRVDDASLNQLGGLSEHLLKLFQAFTSPLNTNARTITGEFSAYKDSVLSASLIYKTKATNDLRKCLLPEKETKVIDSLYNTSLASGFTGLTSLVSEVPESLDGIYSQATYDYSKTLQAHNDCPGTFDVNAYARHVMNTRSSRHSNWSGDTTRIGNNLIWSYSLLVNNGLAGNSLSSNQGTTKVNINVDDDLLKGRYIVQLNNCMNNCTVTDLEVRCRMLYKKTGIHYMFVTADLPYYIPLDSMNAFRDAATQALIAPNPDKNFIIALYLNMHDSSEAESDPLLLIKQTGDWLTKADEDFARFNTKSSYKKGAYYKFTNIYRNIPKPLIICFQIAKVNGLFTTTYIEKAQSIKGREQIYYHSFKLDKAFAEMEQLYNQVSALNAHVPKEGEDDRYRQIQKEEAINKMKVVYLRALKNPQFEDAEVQFKDVYLQSKFTVEAAALKYLQDRYRSQFSNDTIDEIIDGTIIPEDIKVGTCKSPDRSDVTADALGVASLLMSPLGLDFIPDALSVVHFLSTAKYSEAAWAAASIATPACLDLMKKGVVAVADAIKGMYRGEQLIKTANNMQLMAQEANEIVSVFHIKPSDIDPSLTQKIVDKDLEVNQLLTLEESKAKIYSNVSEKLPEAKRKEFITQYLDDAEFRGKVNADVDEVLGWAGQLTDNQIRYYVDLASKQVDKNKVMLGMWDGGGVSSYIAKAGTEYSYFDFGDKWNEVYNLGYKNNDEIWKINKRFLDNQISAGKEIWFSHNPFSPNNEQFYAREVNYLIDEGVKEFEKIGDLWKAKW